MAGIMPDQLEKQNARLRQHAAQLDQFNQSLRANPQYQAFLRSLGADPSGALALTPAQRKQAEAWVRAHVGDIGNLEIDPAGNANQNEGFWKQAKEWGPAVGGSALALFGVPGLFNGALTGGSTAAAGGTSSAAGGAEGLLPATTPVPYSSVALSPPGFAGAGGVAGGGGIGAATGLTSAGSSVIDKIVKAATSPGGLATLATLIPSLMGGGSNPFGDVNVSEELSKTLALQRGRMEQAQPVYDTLVNMAYGTSPIRSRGDAPSGYTPNPAPSGAYQYQAPRFGGG